VTLWRATSVFLVNLFSGFQVISKHLAAELRSASLAQLERPTSQFAEYFEPYTAEPLGSLEQSWTAAVALDWLSAEDYP
jgi:hypothetical protein